MIRRAKAGDVGSPAPSSGGKSAAASGTAGAARPAVAVSDRRGGQQQQQHVHVQHPNNNISFSPVKIWIIVCVVVFGSLMLLSIVSPSSVQEAEKHMYEAERLVESEVAGLFGGGLHEKVIPPVPIDHEPQRRERSIDATDAMLQQDSSWVDGEKKLKQKLKVLAERQAEGKDLGVPVLTRYLGEDIPAWAGEGVDVEEWKKKVEQKYAEMREEENKWRLKVAQFMEAETKY